MPEKLPSWIPLISKSAFGDPRGVVEGRMNGDSFVGGPERKGQQTYNASAGLEAWHKFGSRASENALPVPPQRSTAFPTKFHGDSESSGSAGFMRSPSQRTTVPAATNGSRSLPNEQLALPTPKPQKYDGTLAVRGFCLDVVREVSDRVGYGKIIHDDALIIGGWKPQFKDRNILDDVPDRLCKLYTAVITLFLTSLILLQGEHLLRIEDQMPRAPPAGTSAHVLSVYSSQTVGVILT